ncbi:hypothetical protein H2200_007724 [Cladophialophora chaetospira]|uniref:SnoaL-like domain-containing protein n=1 Tax=Cladophialophora chaetospira TaxID=386627 RepID=A0AA39CGC8_9EURO|nr:hypothetical protein H2200_007724 [Cladophialophora chaetospira]
MGYNTARTQWPSVQSIPDSTKNLIDSYFNLLDTNSDHVGDQLVSEIFTPDAVIYPGPAGAQPIQGSEAIRSMREGAWKVVQKREHVISRVYVFDAAASDLLLLGEVKQVLHNGKVFVGEWAARIRVVYVATGDEADGEKGPDSGSNKRLRIFYHKGWAVSEYLFSIKMAHFLSF